MGTGSTQGRARRAHRLPLASGVAFQSIVLLGAATLAVLPGCAIKTGSYAFSDDDFDELDSGFGKSWELELCTPRFLKERMDVAFGLGYVDGEEHGSVLTTEGTRPKASVASYSLHVTPRVFPLGTVELGRHFRIAPYLGAGMSWFTLRSTERGAGKYIRSDWQWDYYELVEENETLGSGFYPHAVVGIHIPIGSRPPKRQDTPPATQPGDASERKGRQPRVPYVMLVVEYRWNFDKEDRGYDLSGDQFMVGLGFRW